MTTIPITTYFNTLNTQCTKPKILPTIVPTSAGSSGHTFICTMQETEDISTPKIIQLVLKWQNQTRTQNEQIVTQSMRDLGVHVPFIEKIETPCPDLISIACQKKQTMPPFCPSESYPLGLLAIQHLPGKNFLNFVQTNALFDLSPDLQEELFIQLGQVSVFDIFVGNDDRIIRVDLTQKTIIENHKMNSGNVMMNLSN